MMRFMDIFFLALCTKREAYEYAGREHPAWNFQTKFFFFPFKHHTFQQSIYDWCCKVMNHNARCETHYDIVSQRTVEKQLKKENIF